MKKNAKILLSNIAVFPFCLSASIILLQSVFAKNSEPVGLLTCGITTLGFAGESQGCAIAIWARFPGGVSA
jgi:hypothetical protein